MTHQHFGERGRTRGRTANRTLRWTCHSLLHLNRGTWRVSSEGKWKRKDRSKTKEKSPEGVGDKTVFWGSMREPTQLSSSGREGEKAVHEFAYQGDRERGGGVRKLGKLEGIGQKTSGTRWGDRQVVTEREKTNIGGSD